MCEQYSRPIGLRIAEGDLGLVEVAALTNVFAIVTDFHHLCVGEVCLDGGTR